ncbi:MAG: hypothetical protein ACRCWO_05000 [Bosea sp. (in: a-proteobacteria)]
MVSLMGLQAAHAQGRPATRAAPAQPTDSTLAESYWSISVGPRTITLGFGLEPGSEQAAMRIVCTPRDTFMAVNLSRRLAGEDLERLKRVAGSEIAVMLQVERGRFNSRGPVVEPDDPTLPITVVLRSSNDDPALAAMRQGRRVRVSWPQGAFEMPLESFAELAEEWQGRCATLSATASPIEAAPAPTGNPPPGRRAPAAPSPAEPAPAEPAPSGDGEVLRPPANVPGLPPQEPPTIMER